jgi:hypothetical protein
VPTVGDSAPTSPRPKKTTLSPHTASLQRQPSRKIRASGPANDCPFAIDGCSPSPVAARPVSSAEVQTGPPPPRGIGTVRTVPVGSACQNDRPEPRTELARAFWVYLFSCSIGSCEWERHGGSQRRRWVRSS